jgi:steroid 5-alpha reductase family enzyme
MSSPETDSTPAAIQKLPSNAYIRSAIVVSIVLGLSYIMLYLSSDRKNPFEDEIVSGITVFAYPVNTIFFTMLWSFALNWIVFIPANIGQTEKFFDLTGSITYITCTLFSLVAGASPKFDGDSWSFSRRSIVQSIFVILWAIRLGSFLFSRIKKDHKDGRFDQIKINPPRFFAVWTIQGLWVIITALPVFTVNSFQGASDSSLTPRDYIGYAIWAIGFAIEVISDRQKSAFASDPANKGKWIETGLWYYSRHPNYLGEMILWFGNFLAASSIFVNAQWALIISPMFVVFLLVCISGIPGLESRADAKWGNMVEYNLYKKNTSVLLILPKGTCKELDPLNSTLLGKTTTTTTTTTTNPKPNKL